MKIIHAWIILFLSIAHMACAQDLADSVRELNSAQNRMAIGRENAGVETAAKFDAIEALIPTLEPEAWTQPRNLRAAIVYLLGGGAPEHLREIFDAGFIVGEEASLLEASLLNAEGDERAAEKIATYDPEQYPALLGGHLALVQGSAFLGKDDTRAIARLDLARLLMPNSLVEEAALRREIRALDPQNHREKILALASTYAARYRASPYTRHLIADLRILLAGSGIDSNPIFVSKLEPVIDIAPALDRLDIYLALCRSSLSGGRLEEARHRLVKAFGAAETRAMRERVEAYQDLIARLDAPNQPGARLKEPRLSASLTSEDRRIIALVSAVLTKIFKHPSDPLGAESKSSLLQESELVTKVRVRLQHVDNMLKGRKDE